MLGGCAIDATGVPLPQETIDKCKAADATLDNSHGYQAGMYGLQKLITTMFNIYA